MPRAAAAAFNKDVKRTMPALREGNSEYIRGCTRPCLRLLKG
tara:strand:- start:105 stop:230 length:126 start_codon:yes stop_codon:yes gene_type:complete